ncbi:hypothetical protein [Candidatus Harpocratesius sp.]
MINSLQSATLHQKLGAFFSNPYDLEIIFQLIQNKIATVKDLQKWIFPQVKSNNPQIYRRLKKLSQKGWIIPVGIKPLTYGISEQKIFRELLNKEIEQTQNHLQTQKENYYDIVTILDAAQSSTKEESSKKVYYHIIPKNVSPIIKQLIANVHNSTKLSIFNGEYDITIALNQERRQFKLNSVEFITVENQKVLFGGFILVKVHAESNMEKLIHFLHDYHVNGLQFRYKLEKKGYLKKNARSLIEYKFSADRSSCKDLLSQDVQNCITSTFQIKINTQIFKGKILTVPTSITVKSEREGLNLDYLTLWGENEEIFHVLKERIFN